MISLTLPSVYPDALERSLRNLRDATRGPYQVVVVSSFPPPPIAGRYGVVEWVMETDPRGCNAGHAAALDKVRGDYIVAWVDDHLLVDGWDTFSIRDFEVSSMKDRPLLLGLRQVSPQQVGTVFGWYYPYFPMMRASDASEIGWFDGAYCEDFADCDLAMRVYKRGGMARWSLETTVVVHQDDARKSGRPVNEMDMALFVGRWGQPGWDTSHIRGFNLDVDLLNLEHADGRLQVSSRTVAPRGMTSQ